MGYPRGKGNSEGGRGNVLLIPEIRKRPFSKIPKKIKKKISQKYLDTQKYLCYD
jgi:hypothetical protein